MIFDGDMVIYRIIDTVAGRDMFVDLYKVLVQLIFKITKFDFEILITTLQNLNFRCENIGW